MQADVFRDVFSFVSLPNHISPVPYVKACVGLQPQILSKLSFSQQDTHHTLIHGAGKEGSCVWPLPCSGGAPCWTLDKSVLAEGSAELAEAALLGAQPPAKQGPAPCLILLSRERSSLPSSLNSQQVSCSFQPHRKQLLTQEKFATPL